MTKYCSCLPGEGGVPISSTKTGWTYCESCGKIMKQFFREKVEETDENWDNYVDECFKNDDCPF